MPTSANETKNVKVMLSSINKETGKKAVTFLLKRFPYALVQEPATHRILRADSLGVEGAAVELNTTSINPFTEMLSRNSASLRAVTTPRIIEMVRKDPYIPSWTSYCKGMGGGKVSPDQHKKATNRMLDALEASIQVLEDLLEIGISKQDANRYISPYLRIPILITATEWDNFFALRTVEGVQPDFRETALEMKALYDTVEPQELIPGEWHIPFLKDGEKEKHTLPELLHLSTARCAWLSYCSHDADRSYERAVATHDQLIKAGHASPCEHQLYALTKDSPMKYCKNYVDFAPYRQIIEVTKGVA